MVQTATPEMVESRKEAEQLLTLVAYPEWKVLLKSLEEEKEVYEQNIIYNAESMEDINRSRGIILAYNKFVNMREALLGFIEMYDEEYSDAGQ